MALGDDCSRFEHEWRRLPAALGLSLHNLELQPAEWTSSANRPYIDPIGIKTVRIGTAWDWAVCSGWKKDAVSLLGHLQNLRSNKQTECADHAQGADTAPRDSHLRRTFIPFLVIA